jgi:uncharacterized membrane protein YccC
VRATTWVRAHDPGLGALRRAARGAIVMPALFALGDKVIGNPAIATFAAFGSFALLLLVDFSGSISERLRSQAALVLAGAALVTVGTLASRSTWLATTVTALVAFGVLFAGVVSSVLAAATVSMLLAFVLSVSIATPSSQLPDRLAGWGLAGAASLVAIAMLWPAPAADRLRTAATGAARSLARRLHAEVDFALGDTPDGNRDDATAASNAAAAALARTFLATPYRPTGLTSSGRAVVRLVDEIAWLNAIVGHAPPHRAGTAPNRPACAVKTAAATVLERSAELLDRPRGDPAALRAAVADLRAALTRVESAVAVGLPQDEDPVRLVSALDPGFRAQELAFAVTQIAGNVDAAAAADRRPWHERMLGRAPTGLPTAVDAARQRALAHVEPHSVWLHNSLRGAAGLSVAVLVASMTGVQHSFWVILGALSVLRSSALNTGQTALRGLAGTAAGVVIGAALIGLIGTDETVLWALLPVAVLVAGFAPAALSFAAGQAAFTVTLVILYNLIQPSGWHVGLIRIEDVAIGFAVSIVVGLLFWPRGAVTALCRELREAYGESARYLGAAVAFAVDGPEPAVEAGRAAAAARRLDDAFRTFLAERAAKPMPLADMTGLVNGVVGLRLAADAVVDLWREDGCDGSAGRPELLALSGTVVGWYEDLAAALGGDGPPPAPLGPDADRIASLVAAVEPDLLDGAGRARETATRIVWTGDHLDAARRLGEVVAGPAAAVAGRRVRGQTPDTSERDPAGA